MSSFRQRVLNSFKNCTKKIVPYALALAASSNRSTYAGIARSLNVEYHEFYEHIKSFADYHDRVLEVLATKVRKYQTSASPGKIVADFTRVAKSNDAETPMVTKDRNGRINSVNNGFSLGFCAWTNGAITIPLSFCFWLNIKDAGSSYVTKKDLIKDLIKSMRNKLGVSEVIVDGEFATLGMMEFFAEERIEFTARIACNRNITTLHGTKIQLKNCPQLRLRRNERSRTITAYLGGRLYDFTAVKHTTRGGKKKIVFIISTVPRTSKEHVRIYDLRWCIEKFFRTAKQSLGLESCQAQKSSGTINRILAVMLIYSALEETRFAKKKISVEQVLRIIKSKTGGKRFDQYAYLVETYATL